MMSESIWLGGAPSPLRREGRGEGACGLDNILKIRRKYKLRTKSNTPSP